MQIISKTILALICTACLCICLVACSKVTQENFEKIKDNMTMKEVIDILGEPTNSESISIAGISGTSSVWKDKQAEIDIQFLNNHVAVKSFSKLNQAETNEHPTNPHP